MLEFLLELATVCIVIFSPFNTCKMVHTVFNLPRHDFVMFKYDKE